MALLPGEDQYTLGEKTLLSVGGTACCSKVTSVVGISRQLEPGAGVCPWFPLSLRLYNYQRDKQKDYVLKPNTV